VRLTIHREAFGVVLIIGPGNYPLFLPGVQLIQALTAGNAVLLKPGVGGSPAAAMLLDCIHDAGLPRGLVSLLGESPEFAQEAIRAGVDKVVLTGSSDTGKTVLQALAPHVTPAIMELSGWDPVFVLPDADIPLTAAAVRFGVRLNSGNTCIRPRRIFADPDTLGKLREELGEVAEELQLTHVRSEDEALQKALESGYALGAAVFGSPAKARNLAVRIRAGVVVVNDMIVPTAHPAIPFGGRGASGFGVTRGAEGLLELTTVKTIAVQRSRWLPHLQGTMPGDAAMFSAFIRVLHAGSLRKRLSGCAELSSALVRRKKNK
jgi:acyl-CoA reductase-like NAD-dependent aldehyde dehydrogenase